jgi:hypothetical protein
MGFRISDPKSDRLHCLVLRAIQVCKLTRERAQYLKYFSMLLNAKGGPVRGASKLFSRQYNSGLVETAARLS